VAACERELAQCGAETRPEQPPAWNLTASELAVPPGQHRPVQPGSAGELYVSVKAWNSTSGTSSTRSASLRKDLAARLAAAR